MRIIDYFAQYARHKNVILYCVLYCLGKKGNIIIMAN